MSEKHKNNTITANKACLEIKISMVLRTTMIVSKLWYKLACFNEKSVRNIVRKLMQRVKTHLRASTGGEGGKVLPCF